MSHVIQGHEAFFYYTKNMAQSVAFYRDIVGLELIVESDYWSTFRLPDGGCFALHPVESETATEKSDHPMIVFRVANVKASAAHFLEKGLTPASPYVDQDWGEEADFLDIDGNPFRIARFKA